MIKHIDSSMSKESYQVDTVLLSNYVTSDGYNYLFIMVDHFTKYGWIETLKEKTAVIILRAFKRLIRTHYIPTILQTDNGTEFKNKKQWTNFAKKITFSRCMEFHIIYSIKEP